MQYHLLFIYDEDGYHPHTLCASAAPGAKKKTKHLLLYSNTTLTICIRIKMKHQLFFKEVDCSSSSLLIGMLLFNKRDWISSEMNQSILRCEKLCNIRNIVIEGDIFGPKIGKCVVLPASHASELS